MEQMAIEHMISRIHALLGEKLGVRGATLEMRGRRAGRLVPRSVRSALAELRVAEQMVQDPRLVRRIDPTHVRGAYRTCFAHFDAIDVGQRKSKARFDFAAAIIVQFCVVTIATLGLLNWRGFL